MIANFPVILILPNYIANFILFVLPILLQVLKLLCLDLTFSVLNFFNLKLNINRFL